MLNINNTSESHIKCKLFSFNPFAGGIWEQLLKANIGPDMNLHYNLNGIYNRYPGSAGSPDLMRTDGQVTINLINVKNMIAI